jgi:hypothetical protein
LDIPSFGSQPLCLRRADARCNLRVQPIRLLG